jgi:hypothetical protein
MIGQQRVRADAFLQPEILAGEPGIDGVDLSFDALAVAAGVDCLLDIVVLEHRQPGERIADEVIAGAQGFEPQVVPRGGPQR